tara:strand:+ start:1214 stop:1384 length:171 start_codon:yes stop_codon:yes gene_type:complete
MSDFVYELFSGVGFLNQLFSLETAIYLANALERKLVLIMNILFVIVEAQVGIMDAF